MFQLLPGQGTRYHLVRHDRSEPCEFELAVTRPREGLSVELELSLRDANDREVARGRVPLAEGYLAVAREIERQFARALEREDTPDFELVRVGGAEAGA